MNASHDLITVFGGIFGLLAVFSLIGAGLKYRVARGEPHGVIDNLNARIKAWWWMIGLLAGALWIGKPGVIALFFGQAINRAYLGSF